MEVDQVPQEHNRTFGGERKAMYATSRDGHYQVVPSTGSKMEEIVTSQALEEFARLRDEARLRVAAGQSAPLEYHMYDKRMDRLTLAQATGLWRWRVRRHLHPKVFAKLNQTLLQRYADALGLSIEALSKLPQTPHER